MCALSNLRLARNQYSGLELGPTHASLRSRTAIMITTANSSIVKRSGTTINFSVFYGTPSRFWAVPHTNPTFSTARNPIPGTSSTKLLVCGTSLPWRSCVRVASPGGSTCAPFGEATHRHLGRFHQQKGQDRTSLFGDMSRRRLFPLDSSNGTSPR